MKIVFCTIASANYLSRVEVLETSLHKYHPGAELKVLLCEQPDVCRKIGEMTSRSFYSPADIGCNNWLHMAFYYDITAYNTALKPFFLETLLNEGYDAVLYFDPDIQIFSPMDELMDRIERHDVVLTPHVCKPVPDDRKAPDMESYIRAGQFNLGFLGVSNSNECFELLRWWQSVLEEKCIHDPELRYFVDQFWAAIFPSFIENTCIFRDPAYNMAYWNVFQRKLEYADGRWVTDSGDLKFFHFSGLNRADLTKVSTYQNRVTAPLGSPLHRLLEQYFDRICQSPFGKFNDHVYSFARYKNGEPISSDERSTFLCLNRDERALVGDPFDANKTTENVIRIKFLESLASNRSDQPVLLSLSQQQARDRRMKDLEMANEALYNSLSWRITEPLRWLGAIFAGK